VAIHRRDETAQETMVRALTHGAMATEFDTENHPAPQVVENTGELSGPRLAHPCGVTSRDFLRS
jgi:hypothetical protein